MKVFLFLKRLYEKKSESKLLSLFFRILTGIGVLYLARYLFSLWFHKNPTEKMKSEKQFFSEHTRELKEVYDSLEDDRSRAVFENIIKYRTTFYWPYLKKSVGKDNLKNQYFVPELQFSDHEIIVDCGAFNGDTVKRFYKNIPGCRVIAIEPDEKNFELLQKLKLEGLKCIRGGVWSEDTTLTFSDKGGGTAGGAISTSGSTKIEAKTLDRLVECQSATYIKMDVEGAELGALKGAEKTIKEGRPKLAICLYHQPRDFFEIPIYIKKLNPDYKLFVHHHHTCHDWETVLYAI